MNLSNKQTDDIIRAAVGRLGPDIRVLSISRREIAVNSIHGHERIKVETKPIVVRADPDHPDDVARALLAEVKVPEHEKRLIAIVAFSRDMSVINGEVTAYVGTASDA